MRKQIHSILAEESMRASKAVNPTRFFKLTRDGQWKRKSADGNYNHLNTSQLLRRLQRQILKHAKRTTTE